ncbi:MAG TPA: IS30 family transposase [Feifaniaceae bacterium]|nr:IS30 family transposase [Feifaniaceae bacterium]
MGHYRHLTTDERESTMALRSQGLSLRAIARKLKRSPATISREVRRNSKADGQYSSDYAAKRYCKRRKHCCPKRIMENPDLAQLVADKLRMKWSPEQIAGRLALEKYPVRFSYATIYRAIDQHVLPHSLKKELRFKSKYKRHKDDDRRGKRDGVTSISERPEAVNNRSEVGHWESDTVLGKRKTGRIGTHVDRKTGLLVAFKLAGGTPEEFAAATIAAFSAFPLAARRSFTVDRGFEFARYEWITEKLCMPVFFCDPYSPWQRGTNENTNGLLRQFFPKKTSFAPITDEALAHVVALINSRPRKRFGWKSPQEVFSSA